MELGLDPMWLSPKPQLWSALPSKGSRTKYLQNKCVFLPSHHPVWPFQTLRIEVHVLPASGSLGPTEATTLGKRGEVYLTCQAPCYYCRGPWTPGAQCKYFRAEIGIHVEILPNKSIVDKAIRNHLMTGTQVQCKVPWTRRDIKCIPALQLALWFLGQVTSLGLSLSICSMEY